MRLSEDETPDDVVGERASPLYPESHCDDIVRLVNYVFALPSLHVAHDSPAQNFQNVLLLIFGLIRVLGLAQDFSEDACTAAFRAVLIKSLDYDPANAANQTHLVQKRLQSSDGCALFIKGQTLGWLYQQGHGADVLRLLGNAMRA